MSSDMPDWRALAAPSARVPARARPWLWLRSPMMRALRRRTGQPATVRVLRDGAGRLLPDEARVLGRRSRIGQVREVSLQTGEQARVAARTVYGAAPRCRLPGLEALGSRPLGDVLFAGGRPRRLLRQLAAVDAPMALHRLARDADRTLHRRHCPARRTLFVFRRRALLLTEIFLPSLWAGSAEFTVGQSFRRSA